MEEQLRKVTANPPVPGGGLPFPSRSQQMVDETGFPRGKGSRDCPTFCSFSQPCTSPSWHVPAQKGLAGPREPWGHAPALAFTIRLGCSRSAKLDSGQRWQLGQPSARLRGPGDEQAGSVAAFLPLNYLGKRGGGLFKMHMHPSRMKPGNLNCC